MKRKLALLMAFMMAATLVPAQPAFAGTKNQVTNVVTLSSDSKTTTATPLENEVKAPKLFLEGDDATGKKITGTFEVHLPENAEWAVEYDNTDVAPAASGWEAESATGTIKVTKSTKRVLTVTVEEGKSVRSMRIPLSVKLDGIAEGAVKVTVVPLNSSVSAGDYTFATVAGGSIVASVDTKATISRTGSGDVTLVLRENTPTSFKSGQKIKLKLPKDFSWGNPTKQSNGTAKAIEENRVLEITPAVTANQDTVYITVPVSASRTASKGDIDVTVDGTDVSPSSLVIGKYVEYGVDVKAEKVLDVLAGRNEAGKYKAKITIEEPVASSLSSNRYIEFKFVNEKGESVDASLQNDQSLKLKTKSGNVKLEIDDKSIKDNGGKLNDAKDDYKVKTEKAGSKDAKKADAFDLFVKSPADAKATNVEVEVPFVVASDYQGKLFLQVKGAGIEEQKIQIADVKPLVTVEVAKPLPQVKIGLQEQAVSNIIIKETEAGALVEDKDFFITPEEDYRIKINKVKYEVTDGNIVVDDVTKENSKRDIKIKIDRKSSKASTITLKDVNVTLDRTIPYGGVKYKANFGLVAGEHDLTNNVGSFTYITTVTPVNDAKRMTTVFKIGATTYTEVVNGESQEVTMDAAPVAKNGRTMLPIRYVANALGVNVSYNEVTRTAYFTNGGVVAALRIDGDSVVVNGTTMKLEVAPVKADGRILIAIRDIARVLGINENVLVWNQEAQTVTVLPQDASAEEIAAAQGK